MGTIWFDAEPTAGSGLIRIKIESNVAEVEPFRPFVARKYGLTSRWWSGGADVLTCPQLRLNLQEKLSDPVFIDDTASLLVAMPENYNVPDAALLVLQRLGARLRNAPPEGEAISLA